MSLTRKWIPSPNVSTRGNNKVRLIVMHTAEGARTYQSLGVFFGNPNNQVSSHVGIDSTPGVIGEYVSPDRSAWTAAAANPTAIQAELCAFARYTRLEWLANPAMLNNAGDWVGEEAQRNNIPLRLLNDTEAQDRSTTGICEHKNLGRWGGGHVDCGPNLPWDVILARAGAGSNSTTKPSPKLGIVAMGGTTGGYHLFASDGGVFTFGNAPFYGSLGNTHLNSPVVDGTSRLDGSGYYLAAADGGIFTFGPNAPFLGSLGSTRLNAPIASIAPDPDGQGYWLFAQDGGVFTFDAPFYGSLATHNLNKPIVAAAATSNGYYMVASDGGVFSFGPGALFFGSLGNVTLNKPIVDITVSPSGLGYTLYSGDGGVFNFGDAQFHGSLGSTALNAPIVGALPDPDGTGYWMAGSDGGVFSFEAPFYGSALSCSTKSAVRNAAQAANAPLQCAATSAHRLRNTRNGTDRFRPVTRATGIRARKTTPRIVFKII